MLSILFDEGSSFDETDREAICSDHRRAHRAQLPHCPPLCPGDGLSRRGPGAETNWLIHGRLLCGAKPEQSRDHEALSAITHFVDLTEGSPQVVQEAIARAEAVGREPPTFMVHTITEYETGEASVALEAVGSIVQVLAEDPAAVVYLHCRAGHGRTGMIAAILIGLAYPTLAIPSVMSYIQDAHNDRENSWNNWHSPETDEQRTFAQATIETVRGQIAIGDAPSTYYKRLLQALRATEDDVVNEDAADPEPLT